ncbi:MAG: ferritin family protein [Thermoplasmatota archaeon]
MKREINDLRILKLAEMYEIAYERFVLDVALGIVPEGRVRSRLLTLAGPSDGHHERIVNEMKRLNAGLTAAEQAEIVAAAVLDVVEVERAAHDFYSRFAEQLHDPEIARLFRDLANEESGHVAIAERALGELAERSDVQRALHVSFLPPPTLPSSEGASHLHGKRRP